MSSSVLVSRITEFIIQPLIGLLFAAATVVFVWGIFQFIAGSDSEDARSEGKRHMLYGLIGMFIMVAAWGILNISARTFDINVPYYDTNLLR